MKEIIYEVHVRVRDAEICGPTIRLWSEQSGNLEKCLVRLPKIIKEAREYAANRAKVKR